MDTKNLSPKEYLLLVKTHILDIIDNIKYDRLGQKFDPSEMGTPPASLWVTWEYSKKEKSFYAECDTHPGIFTVGRTDIESIINLNNAAYKYFGVPRFLAKKYGLIYKPPLEQLERLKKSGAPIKLELKRLPVQQYAQSLA